MRPASIHDDYLNEPDLQRLYNELVASLESAGERLIYVQDVVREVAKPFLPAGSVEVIEYVYRSSREQIAIVHFYRCPDGSIGASGLKDPIWLRFNGKEYRRTKQRPRP